MALKRRELWICLAVTGVLITAAAAWKLLFPFAGSRLSYVPPRLSTGEISRPGRPLETGRHTRTNIPQKKTSSQESSIVHGPLEPPPAGPAPTSVPLDPPGFSSEEEDDDFAMMNEALAEDFPELELSETQRIELYEAVRQIRLSFATARSLARSAENALTFQQLERDREAAIEQFEQIVGMSFDEFMLRSAGQDGGVDRR